MGGGGPLSDLAHAPLHLLLDLGPECPHPAPQFDLGGNDVVDFPTVELGHAQYRRVHGIEDAARDRLQRGNNVRADDDGIDAGFPGLWEGYAEELERRIVANPMRLLPGVKKLIQALEAEAEVALGLVTGNIARGARLKLGSVGLDGRFHVGGYGSDHEERDYLPGIALSRAAETWGVRFETDCVFVIGDTPHDVQCGKHHGTRTVAVATGHFDEEQLEAVGADVVFEDFSEVSAVLEILLA